MAQNPLAIAPAATARWRDAPEAIARLAVLCRRWSRRLRAFPVAVEEDGRGVFKVRAALAGRLGRDFHWLRPGMEGVAHISMGRRRYAWMWTRPLVKRLRIWLWL